METKSEFNNDEIIIFLSSNVIKVNTTIISVKHITSVKLSEETILKYVLTINCDDGEKFKVYGERCAEYFNTLTHLLSL